MPDESLTYLSAGVNIDEAQRALRGVLPDVQATYTENVVAGVGGFGGLFHASFPGIDQPVLVASIDGVGTKTRVASMVGEYGGLGKDIVNHCINDILCQARGRSSSWITSRPQGSLARFWRRSCEGHRRACRAVGCALLGGETAEMPGVYAEDEIDVVGSIVGVVEYARRLPRPTIRPGDTLIGIASDGLHTNGFSLARKSLFEIGGLSVRQPVPGLNTTIGEELLRPHRCYFNALYPLLQEEVGIKSLAHITGGGLHDNVPRALPPDTQAIVERRTWTPQPLFMLIQELGGVPDYEMYRTFNMGIGMVVVVDSDAAPAVVQRLSESGESAAVIGSVQHGAHDVQFV
ncbi:MAG: phosphoribosylaminoimidazole synthetase [Armatimonadetes bacterium OLB18]|nr:MAG: phosphoribosylaminoimidazole synthetase [Armatimonadetes bacterium OLB18]